MTVSVTALGYVGIGASDLGAWRDYAGNVLGLACEEADGALLLRLDGAPWRLRIEPSDADDIAFAGFETAGPEDLERLCGHLENAGVACAAAAQGDCAARGVERLVRCQDPDGIGIELYCGRAAATTPFESPRGLRFVTGDQGLGHMVLMVKDVDAARRFYQEALGFRLSDTITMGQPPRALELTFLHCNPRHHTVALAPVPGAPRRLNHLMLQVDDLDAVGATLDLIRERQLPLSMGLGRHSNDHMLSFYARTPSGFDVEFGYGARTIDDATWTVDHYDSGSLWGHRRESPAAR